MINRSTVILFQYRNIKCQTFQCDSLEKYFSSPRMDFLLWELSNRPRNFKLLSSDQMTNQQTIFNCWNSCLLILRHITLLESNISSKNWNRGTNAVSRSTTLLLVIASTNLVLYFCEFIFCLNFVIYVLCYYITYKNNVIVTGFISRYQWNRYLKRAL